MMKSNMFKKVSYALFAVFAALSLQAKNVNLEFCNVIGDGKTDNTKALQAAIDECSSTGGGEVIFPKDGGVFLSKTLFLKDNVTLNLSPNTVLKANAKNFGKGRFISANGATNIGLKGGGTVDGSGADFPIGEVGGRAHMFILTDCKNVRIEDIKITASSCWNLFLQRCDTVFINNIHLTSHANWNNDGIDIEAKNVVISNSIIDCDDDAICPKSHSRDFIVENITITNCIISSNCNFIKFGTANQGGFRNVAISNCVLKKCTQSNFRKWDTHFKSAGVTAPITGIGGIAIEAVDGGFAERITVSNLAMTDVQTPIFIRVGHRNKDEQKSYIKDVIISNITATSESWFSNSITSVPGHALENVIVRDCIFNMKGAMPEREAEKLMEKKIPEQIAGYPENRMFGNLPGYGFYIRHAKNITLDNIQLNAIGGEFRHAIVADDVNSIRIMNGIFEAPKGDADAINFIDCKDVYQFNNKIVKK